MLQDLLRAKNISIYKCAKETQIPYTTLRELLKGKNNYEKCSIRIYEKLANYFHFPIDFILHLCEDKSIEIIGTGRKQLYLDRTSSKIYDRYQNCIVLTILPETEKIDVIYYQQMFSKLYIAQNDTKQIIQLYNEGILS